LQRNLEKVACMVQNRKIVLSFETNSKPFLSFIARRRNFYEIFLRVLSFDTKCLRRTPFFFSAMRVRRSVSTRAAAEVPLKLEGRYNFNFCVSVGLEARR
jgi:hypothetical protein